MVDTWANLTEIRFDQDTTNPSFKAALDRRDEISPKITELDAKVQRKLVGSCHRGALEKQFGPQAFAIWEMRIRSFDPVIEDDLVQESKLTSRYNELLASAKLSFQGEEHNLSGILQFTEDADRQVRHDALEVGLEPMRPAVPLY
jgi:oligoendopeptidase F